MTLASHQPALQRCAGLAHELEDSDVEWNPAAGDGSLCIISSDSESDAPETSKPARKQSKLQVRSRSMLCCCIHDPCCGSGR